MKILAIWITKGLFIFVICIVEWNVCSNLGTIHCKVLSQTNGSVQSFTFSGTMGGRKPFLYYHGCQVSKRGTLICGVIQDEGIMVADKIYGDADIEIDKLTIKTTLLSSWSYGYVIYFS